MKPNRARLVGMVAALSTIAIAAPVSTASAATAAPPIAPVVIVSAGPDGHLAVTLPAPGRTGTVMGPTFVTDGSAAFTDTHIVVSSGDASVVG
jgi:hypothetical protein